MKLYFYRGNVPNFGDELNTWLMPRVFKNFFDANDNTIFLGIGSIILDIHAEKAKKVVFGSGYGGYTKLPKFDENWNFYCVRGPLTARACNLESDKIAGDSAILINKFRPYFKPEKANISFMPHWESVARGKWQLACQIAGVKFIDPRQPVEEALDSIQNSTTIITEAMHGAIVADALRVPWVPVLPLHASHRMKWLDWAAALEIDLKSHRIWPSSIREAYVSWNNESEGIRFQNAQGPVKLCIDAADWGFVRLAAARLRHLKRMPPNLSSDQALSRAIERLEVNAAAILRDFKLA